jgi:phage terminase Nu1 subunit (DNA packaging protein)
MATINKLTWPAEKMSKFIDLSPRRLRQLVDEGVVPREERGRYNPFAVTVAYIRFLRDRVQSPEASDSEFFAVKLAKLKAEREQIELQNAKFREEFYPRDFVHFWIKHAFLIVTATLKGNVNRLLTVESVNDIFDQVRSAFTRMQEDGAALEKEYEKEKEEKAQAANGSDLAAGTLGSNSRGNDSSIPATG